jgi:hypothetical protein
LFVNVCIRGNCGVSDRAELRLEPLRKFNEAGSGAIIADSKPLNLESEKWLPYIKGKVNVPFKHAEVGSSNGTLISVKFR